MIYIYYNYLALQAMISEQEIRQSIGRKLILIKGSGETYEGVVLCYRLREGRILLNLMRVIDSDRSVRSFHEKRWLDIDEFSVLSPPSKN